MYSPNCSKLLNQQFKMMNYIQISWVCVQPCGGVCFRWDQGFCARSACFAHARVLIRWQPQTLCDWTFFRVRLNPGCGSLCSTPLLPPPPPPSVIHPLVLSCLPSLPPSLPVGQSEERSDGSSSGSGAGSGPGESSATWASDKVAPPRVKTHQVSLISFLFFFFLKKLCL